MMDQGQTLCNACMKETGGTRKERDRLYDRQRKDKAVRKIYQTARWRKVRALAMQRANGLCELCLEQGQVKFAADVHHKVPIKEDPSKAYALDNLVCVCRKCHRKEHKKLEQKGEGRLKLFLKNDR